MLFNLQEDPREHHNLIDANPDIAYNLHRQIERWWKEGRKLDPMAPILTDEERTRAFRALGYIQ